MARRADPLKPGRRHSGPAWAWALVAAVALAQLAWLGWFLAEPLPNAPNTGGRPVSRGLLLARGLPHVVPGVEFRESLLGLALEELSHLGNLPQRLPIVAAAALIAGAALGLGLLGLRALGLRAILEPAERLALGFGLGAAGLGAATLLLGRAGLLAAWPVRVGLGLLAVAGAWDCVRGLRAGAGAGRPLGMGARSWAGFLLVVGPFLLVMALASMLPTIDFDSIEYHLQGPKEYFQAGRIAFLEHNVYTSMPFNVEMLHLLGMVVLGDWWWGALAGQLLVALHAPMAGLAVMLSARRWGSPRAAWFAGLVYLTTPWVYRLAAIPYVEGPLCYYQAALAYAAGLAWGSAEAPRRGRLWGLAGLLAGGAMACKYTALLSAPIPFGAMALADAARRRSPAPVLAFVVGWAVVMGPWLGKNIVDTGSPVYPLGYSVFGGRYWDDAMEARWAAAHGRKPVTLPELSRAAVDVAGRSDWQSPLYLALAPLAFLRPGSRRAALAFGGLAAYLFASWWLFTHRLDHFWLPMLPALAVLAGLGADWTRSRAWPVAVAIVVGLGVATNAVYCSTALAGLNEWTRDLAELRRSVPERLNMPLVRMDRALPPGARPLLVGQAAVFHVDRPLVYNTVFDAETIETIARGRTPEEVRAELAARGITHVYVDWQEVARYRSPGNYGFTDFVTPELFAGLAAAGVLEGPTPTGPAHELYRVVPPGGP